MTEAGDRLAASVQTRLVRHAQAIGAGPNVVLVRYATERLLYRASRGRPVEELTAYEAVLAKHHYVRRLDQRTHLYTRAALERAGEIEPSYAEAWAALSDLYGDSYAYDMSPIDAPVQEAERCVERALDLDPDCQDAHYASASVGLLTQDHSRIVSAADNVLRLNPNAAYMVGACAVWLGIAGQFDRAFTLFELSLELNPRYPGWFHFLPWLHAFTEGDYERALAAADQLNTPLNFWDPMLRAATLGKLGRTEQATRAYQEVVALRPDFAARYDHFLGCFIHADETRRDVFDGLRLAGLRLVS